MIKRVKRSVYVLLTCLIGVVGCSKSTLISDEVLSQIFHDAYLANAYISENSLNLDSLRLYEPIFQKYGYTTEDVQFTIGSFSTRKSARLSDVVERTISMLESRGLELDKHLSDLKLLDEIALKRTSQIIYQKAFLEYSSPSDSSKMKIIIDDPRPGKYLISFDYLTDSLDRTIKNTKSISWIEEDSVISESQRGDNPKDSIKVIKRSESNANLKRREVGKLERVLVVNEAADRIVVMVASNEDKNTKRHTIIKNLEIKRTPDLEEAREMLFKELVGIKIFDDELLLP